jgi:hypothetical protein
VWLRVGIAAVFVFLAGALLNQVLESVGVAPRLLGQYIERRASGHANWIEAVGHNVNRVMQALDRGDTLPHPTLPAWAGARAAPASSSTSQRAAVALPEDLRAALAAAKPGDVIVIGPGTYRFSGAALETPRGGTEAAPITVRAETLGTVTLEFDMLAGFVVTAPFWRFENLVVRGVCEKHESCEHAFHITGPAHHVVVQNNRISDFNAHLKINGHDGRFPDHGRIVSNTLVNDSPRETETPVTPIDLVAASNWTIEGNLIVDFVKAAGNLTSYGAFAKGAGGNNRFVRNVVICERRLRGVPGRRIGLSFGGGGSDPAFCRDRKCIIEHEDGLMADNLITSCSDEGIYVRNSPRSHLVHNTLLDTAGISIRYPESSAEVRANLVDGPIRHRDGALLDEQENMSTPLWALYLGWHPVRRLFIDPEAPDLRFKSPPDRLPVAEPARDLCGQPRPSLASVGAFEDFRICLRDGVR